MKKTLFKINRRFFLFLSLFLFMSAPGVCNIQSKDPKKIVIFGAGYVGTVSGACLAQCGHKVTFIDPNIDKIAMLNRKKSPISEPKLEALISQGFECGLLEAKGDLGQEILEADIAIIAVATSTTEQGLQELGCVRDIFALLNESTQRRKKTLIVSIRSTILPSAYQQLKNEYLKQNHSISLVINPEFLRESTAVDDFFHPPFCVAGGDDEHSVQTILSLYQDICPKRFAVSGELACLLKYACNAFHAAKIVFTNEIASLCDSLKINPIELMEIFCQDTILNSSSAYCNPGFSFGGSCLAKDLRALISLGSGLGNVLPLLSAILPSNQARFQKFINTILQANHKNLAILGMSFKKNSDDVRESPFVDVIERLHLEEINLRVFDPDVLLETLANSNPEFCKRFDYLLLLIKPDLPTTLAGCDGVVVCKDLLSGAWIEQLKDAHIPVYDLGYFYSQENLPSA
jgi:GDP-mannose 6-dehydrogenase